MSGEQDPVTPPSYGEAVLKGLSNGRHLVLRGQGHNVIGQGCMPKLVSQFIESTDAKALDAKCLDAIDGHARLHQLQRMGAVMDLRIPFPSAAAIPGDIR